MTGLIVIVALSALALVGLDLALRPQRHVDASAKRVERGRAVPLEALSHRLFPRFENAGAYRATGLAIVAAAIILALVVR
jgi:hypothetical protein